MRARPPADGVVLAGGRSERFGRDKLAEPYRGRPLLQHPIEQLLDVCDRVIVVQSPAADASTLTSDDRIVVARDAGGDRGPLAGLAAGLERVDTEWALVAGGDMPELVPAVLEELLRACRETSAVAAALADAGDTRPLPCALKANEALAVAERLLANDRLRLRDLLAEVRTVVIDEPSWTALDPERRTLFDVDEPSDLEVDR
jgi:molybdopterin-guanine dinucleotide biosynthesis protein A